MPDSRRHRGAHPEDRRLFSPAAVPVLRTAVAELSWLLGRGYAENSALKLVGDRHNLVERQRTAVRRCACPDAVLAARLARRVPAAALAGRRLWIDGFNVLNTLESALSGGVVLLGRDGAARDLAGVHGTYRRVEETAPALRLFAARLAGWGVAEAVWWLDAPVGNSGRLAALMRELAAAETRPWRVETVPSPDRTLIGSGELIATADSAVLDAAAGPGWFSLAAEVVASDVPDAWSLDLSDREPPPMDGCPK